MLVRLFAAIAALLFLCLPSLALEPDQIFDRFFTQWGVAKGAATYVSVEKTGETGVVFKGVSLGKEDDSLRIESLTLEGIVPDGTDIVLVSKAQFGPITRDSLDPQGKKIAMRIDGARASGIRLLAPTSQEPMVSPAMPLLFEAGPISVTLDGAPAVNLAAFRTKSALDASGQTIVFSMDAPGIGLDLSGASPRMKGQAEALGFEAVRIDLSMKGNWNPATGHLVLEDYRIAEQGTGALSASLVLEGYTLASVAAFRQFGQRYANLGVANGEAKQAASRELTDLLSSIKLSAFNLKFEDRSFAARFMAVQSQAAGATPQEMAPVFAEMAGASVSPLLGESFATQVSQALGAFLANPGSIVLSASPKEPVAIPQIIETFLNSPNAIAALLALQISSTR